MNISVTNTRPQIKSAVILGAVNSFGRTEVIESVKSRDHTEKMLRHNTRVIKIKKGMQSKFTVFQLVREISIPADKLAKAMEEKTNKSLNP